MAFQDQVKTVKCETGNMLFARLGSRPCTENLESLFFNSLTSGSVIEISGESNSGKTELLYHFIARCIFPSTWKGLHLNGLDCGVVFIDSDCHFNMFRLITILESRIIAAQSDFEGTSSLTNAIILSFIKERLKLLHIMKCTSSEQLIISLYSLEDMLGCDNVIGIIMIDSLSAFYWVDKMNVMNQWKKLEEYYAKLVSALMKLVLNYSLTLFATKCGFSKSNERELHSEEKQDSDKSFCFGDDYDFLGKQWQQFVTYRLVTKWNSAQTQSTSVTVHKTSCDKKETFNCIITDAGFEIL